MNANREKQRAPHQSEEGASLVGDNRHRRLGPPIVIGAGFAALAIVLTLAGLWRESNLSLRNVILGIVLCGGTWGLVSWAIATTVVQVDEDVASGRHEDGRSEG